MNEDKHTNALIDSKSPYLLQHAHNPVDWQPWSEEALREAKKRDLPVLVSIGYAACHWCHVMERESFEDEGVAGYMNRHFINIKIDREERPDLDELFMDALQYMGISGGWPLNCFLTPEGKPFYGGTYFPPKPMHGRPSWMQMLKYIHDIYTNEREKVEKQADRLEAALKQRHTRFVQSLEKNPAGGGEGEFPLDALKQISSQMDLGNGGFGAAPKFPHWMSLNFLLKLPASISDENFPFNSLDKMITGGIYDQVGGGICRYATDAKWRIPHFEKMLYDNAQLIETLALACRRSGDHRYRYYIEDTLAFIKRELQLESGGIAASLDADSEGVEGLFYTWKYEEIKQALNDMDPSLSALFDLRPEGNWEDRHIIYWTKMPDTVVPRDESKKWWDDYAQAMRRLRKIRTERVRPERDHKEILSWNALLVWKTAAAIEAGALQGERKWCNDLLDYLLDSFYERENGSLKRLHAEGKTYEAAQLEDYAYLARALLAVHQWSQDKSRVGLAEEICTLAIQRFGDGDDLYFYSSATDADIPSRSIGLMDNVMPSANAVMAECLYIMGRIYDRAEWSLRADRMVQGLWASARQYPLSFGYWLELGVAMRGGSREVVIIGGEAAGHLSHIQNKLYLPNALYFTSGKGGGDWPLLKGRTPETGTNIYICENMSCKLPVQDPEKAIDLLK